jgi:hypothetical protein
MEKSNNYHEMGKVLEIISNFELLFIKKIAYLLETLRKANVIYK